ncbi:putative FAD-binding Berberine family protein, partial [Melia azedarach]
SQKDRDNNMKHVIFLLSLLLLSVAWATSSNSVQEEFLKCMSTKISDSSQIIFSQNSSSYSSVLQFSIQNLRWLNSSNADPLVIITPLHESEIQAAVLCSRKYDLQIRVRSGGHDYEGLSYLSKTPFIIIDLINMRSVEVNVKDETAWVQSGATLGEFYYAIAKKSSVLGFPAGICPTLGLGGHVSGGGFGTLVRKYGLAADNILDAYVIDVNGRILDRKAMGEDLFWAIRGGNGASFGIIVSWKVKLVRVPETVTTFTVSRTVEGGVTKVVHRWQNIVSNMDEDLFIRVIMGPGGQNSERKTLRASFNSMFLGKIDKLIPLMNRTFPELGLKAEDCTEMSWIESTLYFPGFSKGSPLEVLLNREQVSRNFFKAKSDFVAQPIPVSGLEGIWDKILEEEIGMLIMEPLGGKMNQISESEVPFPHRKGNLYNIQYLVQWQVAGVKEANRHLNWIRSLYEYMKPFVSKSPRAAYVNYRDIDLGTNKLGKTSYSEAAVWGIKYFKGNFKRLAQVKSKVDPGNFFRNEQSIPPFTS